MPNVIPKSMFEQLAEFSFSTADLAAYRAFSKDDNPVHQSGVVFGIQLMATVESCLVQWLRLTPTHETTYYFLEKVFVDETLQLLSTRTGRFEVWHEDKLVGKGVII
ncbi:hypothetical protein ACFQ5M_06165 [Agrilactobacillus yilanensis]|uniref:Uncharacterized protein n=1 Tax=Agrilactobacillus yilanensis TaxID=2485997 RepID=A0ABW4J6W4_9LACO|nr:hypothetical protein [Agrilactobacillus yilanensis]